MLNRKDFINISAYSIFAALSYKCFTGIYKRMYNVRDIIEFPDPTLFAVSDHVEIIDSSIISISENIISTLKYMTLIKLLEMHIPRGLSAPQIGINKRLIVCGMHGEINVMVNPVIIDRSGVFESKEECLSLPAYDEEIIKRSAKVKVKYTGLDNIEHKLVVSNRYAALLQHEVDHLNGILYIDHII